MRSQSARSSGFNFEHAFSDRRSVIRRFKIVYGSFHEGGRYHVTLENKWKLLSSILAAGKVF